jgi:hypothetical protein
MAGPTGCGRHVGGALGRVGIVAGLRGRYRVTALDLGGSAALAFILRLEFGLARRVRLLGLLDRNV